MELQMHKSVFYQLAVLLILAQLAGCANVQLSDVPIVAPPKPTVALQAKIDPYRLILSVQDQKMTLLSGSTPVARYLVSTAEKGVGEVADSGQTPRGRHAVAEKIGAGAAIGTVFRDRLPTSEIVAVNTPGRAPIVTRILRLRGLEIRNQNTFQRYIYLHGTPAENLLGTPASEGTIRMRSEEIIDLFERVDIGTEIWIFEESTEIAIAQVTESDARLAELRKAATMGSPEAFGQLCIGYMYGERGLPMNDVSALAWCSRAADKDDANAITLVGELYEFGRGIAVDFVIARQFYERAAKLGHPHAQFKTALMYQSGIGGAADAALAEQYLELSVKQGYERALKQVSVKAQ
jgi:lipoprotein-anchoring transpeptidase ErfK/SrfK